MTETETAVRDIVNTSVVDNVVCQVNVGIEGETSTEIQQDKYGKAAHLIPPALRDLLEFKPESIHALSVEDTPSTALQPQNPSVETGPPASFPVLSFLPRTTATSVVSEPPQGREQNLDKLRKGLLDVRRCKSTCAVNLLIICTVSMKAYTPPSVVANIPVQANNEVCNHKNHTSYCTRKVPANKPAMGTSATGVLSLTPQVLVEPHTKKDPFAISTTSDGVDTQPTETLPVGTEIVQHTNQEMPVDDGANKDEVGQLTPDDTHQSSSRALSPIATPSRAETTQSVSETESVVLTPPTSVSAGKLLTETVELAVLEPTSELPVATVPIVVEPAAASVTATQPPLIASTETGLPQEEAPSPAVVSDIAVPIVGVSVSELVVEQIVTELPIQAPYTIQAMPPAPTVSYQTVVEPVDAELPVMQPPAMAARSTAFVEETLRSLETAEPMVDLSSQTVDKMEVEMSSLAITTVFAPPLPLTEPPTNTDSQVSNQQPDKTDSAQGKVNSIYSHGMHHPAVHFIYTRNRCRQSSC